MLLKTNYYALNEVIIYDHCLTTLHSQTLIPYQGPYIDFHPHTQFLKLIILPLFLAISIYFFPRFSSVIKFSPPPPHLANKVIFGHKFFSLRKLIFKASLAKIIFLSGLDFYWRRTNLSKYLL